MDHQIAFYQDALKRIANEFGITDPIQLVIRVETEEETYVDVLIRIIREDLKKKLDAWWDATNDMEIAKREKNLIENETLKEYIPKIEALKKQRDELFSAAQTVMGVINQEGHVYSASFASLSLQAVIEANSDGVIKSNCPLPIAMRFSDGEDEREPVAWLITDVDEGTEWATTDPEMMEEFVAKEWMVTPLYK